MFFVMSGFVLSFGLWKAPADTLRIAVAKRYFRLCDAKGRGRINKKQFEIALLAVDPNNPKRTVGFRPGAYLTPKDAFELFDDGNFGEISLGEFSDILHFLGRLSSYFLNFV